MRIRLFSSLISRVECKYYNRRVMSIDPYTIIVLVLNLYVYPYFPIEVVRTLFVEASVLDSVTVPLSCLR
jgi:hypothetical protein